MKIVLDNNILVLRGCQSVRPGWSSSAVDRSTTSTGHIVRFVDELSDVLRYDRVRSLHGLNDEQIGQFIQGIQLAALIIALSLQPPPRVVPNDPDDDYLVATAIEGEADMICTRDRDLFHPAVVSHCQAHGVSVMDDVELLRRIRP